MQELTQLALEFGGSNALTGASTSRTLMLKELSTLLAATTQDTARDEYKTLVVGENVLMKPSASTRSKTYAFLRDRYALDPDVPIFRILRLLWNRDEQGQPLMALLVAAFRDPVLRSTMPGVVKLPVDQHVTAHDFGRIIGEAFPDRFTDETLTAAAERTSSSYKQSGHLRGRVGGVRQVVAATPGSTTIALLLATLDGLGGLTLLDSAWVRLLDSPAEMVLAEARVAAGRGWLEYRQAGDVLEISFRQLLSAIGVTNELRRPAG